MLKVSTLFLLGSIYLLSLFGIAFCTDRGWISARLVRHPVVYILSLGVFVSAWGYYGIVGIAHDYGYDFLPYYFGISGFFLFGPLILIPIQRICQDHQLSSLADLMTFRYRSQWAGILATGFLSIALLPLIASQVKAINDAAQILTQVGADNGPMATLPLAFCIVIALFTMFYGATHVSYRKRHNGLVAAIAFESLVKLAALIIIGTASIMGVFGGLSGMNQWLADNPAVTAAYNSAARQEGRTLLLLSFFAALGMPHMFHMLFSEKPTKAALRASIWGMPLLLLVFSLPVFPILWGALAGKPIISPEYFNLAIGLQLDSPALTAIAYIGGLSAASGVIIVSTLAVASMQLNHLILPFYQPATRRDIYTWLVWIRRFLIAAIILSSYLFYTSFASRDGVLFSMGLAAFAATLQFLPGILALLFVPAINHQGFIAGLLGGMCSWLITLFLPILSSADAPLLSQDALHQQPQGWPISVIFSLGINVLLMLLISAITKTPQEEKTTAAVCSLGGLTRPQRQGLRTQSVPGMQSALATSLGSTTARQEVSRALQDLELRFNETRPQLLRQLCYQIEANLSGLLGTTLARDIVRNKLLHDESENSVGSDDLQLIETRLEGLQMHFTGLAAELDRLRRFHRQTLMDLPIGVCVLGRNKDIVLWNQAMATLSGIDSSAISGELMDKLPPPWDTLLPDFAEQADSQTKKQLSTGGDNRWFTLHKAQSMSRNGAASDTILLLEDITEIQHLEDGLIHSERLASVGRLAAGIAHEIGNPVTGIASLAQNLRAVAANADSIETAEDILTLTERITGIVQTLINFSHGGGTSSDAPAAPVHIGTCVDEAIKLLLLDKEAPLVQYRNLCGQDHLVNGNLQRLIQVFINLLSNARDACEQGQAITIESLIKNKDFLEISVTDQGSGIEPTLLNSVFEPFFTTKSPGRGTGLGLALVYSIVEDQQGSITVESPVEEAAGGGTRFTISLPRPPLAD